MTYYTERYHSNPEFKEKRLAQTRKWGRSERGRKAKRKWYDEHIGTERGYLLDRWYNLTSRVNRRNRKKVSLDITRKEFFELWEEHKKHHGWNCAYTGKLMTRTRSMNELNLTSKDLRSGKNSLQKVRTNMSVDRIDSDKGYTKDNITFCTWDFNDRKGNISVADIRCILELIESRKKADLDTFCPEKPTCSTCQCKFDLDKEGGTMGEFGIIPVAFCPTCLSSVFDMVEKLQ